ncbi:hypothetical protein ACTFIV_007211 [Dictyostelium citrinum]
MYLLLIILPLFNPNNSFISNNYNQNDNSNNSISQGNNQMNPFIFSNNNNDNNRLEITTTPITEIIRRQPPTQTWGISNYEKYHYIEPLNSSNIFFLNNH